MKSSRHTGVLVVAAAAAVGLLATACSSEKSGGGSAGTTSNSSSDTGSGSGAASSSGSSAAAPAKKYTIGIANQQESVTFPAAIANGAKAQAAKLGIKIIDLDSKGDQATQANQVQDLIAQKVSAILLVPLSPGPAQALVDQAAASNIPIATAHGYVGASRSVSDPYSKLKFVIDENEEGAGATAGQMALKAVPNGGQVAVITGAAGFVENTTRVEKFKAALPKNKYSVVATQPGNWTKQDGQSACQNILAAHPKITLIYAISDDMAVGCAAAVQSAGSKAKIIGVGGSKGGIAAIKAGQLYGTVCYKPYDEGAKAIQMLYDALTGKLTGPPKTTFYSTPGVTKANVGTCTPQW